MQINLIRNQTSLIRSDSSEVKCQWKSEWNLYSENLDDPEEIKLFLNVYHLPKWSPKDINNLDIWQVIGVKMLLKASHQRKSRARWNSLLHSTNFQGRSILLNLFHKRKSDGTSQRLFYEACQNQVNMQLKKKITDNFFDEHRWKNFQQNICKPNSETNHKDYILWLSRQHFRMSR